MLLASAMLMPGMAQTTKTDTIRYWDLTSYSQTTINNLAADTELWEYNSKGRYLTKTATDGLELKANGVVIAELKELFISANVEAGSLLLRHAMGENNGLQLQRSAAIRIEGLKAGQALVINMKSSSKDSQGIASVENLEGECGTDTYKAQTLNTYTFKVLADGSVSFTNSPGVVYKDILVSAQTIDERPQVEAVNVEVSDVDTVVNGMNKCYKRLSLSCPTKGAKIYYTLISNGNVKDYAQVYEGAFVVDRRCKLRTYASMGSGYSDSEVLVKDIDVELSLPCEGRPWVLDPEKLDRGAIATEISTSTYLINWRWLVDDPQDVCFNVYADDTKLNSTPLRKTNFSYRSATVNKFYIEVLSDGQVIERSEALFLPNAHLEIPLNRPSGGTTPSGAYTYTPGDCMAADVDGDGQYEIVMKWDPVGSTGVANTSSNSDAGMKDNSQTGYAGNVIIDAYRMDGTQLWRIDLGVNIRAGAHYTQLMVYDLDGDGRAEVACKTAPGTIDGKGNYVLMGSDDPKADYRADYGGKQGIVITGPEYLTVFSGLTGEALATTAYNPPRNIISNWGDSYGNRCERYLACVAYLNGKTPSLVMCRGYYTAAFLWAVDFDGKNLTTRWLHSSTKAGMGAYGEGAHSISTADVDGDGCDEIVYGACCIDHDGTLIYRTGLGHGDAMHVGDLNPDRKGLEVMMVHEETDAAYGIEMHDALTGEIICGTYAGSDVGRGLCADINKDHRGCEFWGYNYNVYTADGKLLSSNRPSTNFRTYWDGDIYEEVTEKGETVKHDGFSSRSLVNFVSKYGAGTNLIKATPCLQADIFGDWREEQIYYDEATKSKLMIFSTTSSTLYMVPCLMQDHHYRMATVWQTAAYNQPPHLSYYLPDYIEYLKKIEAALPQLQSRSDLVETRYYDLTGRRVEEAREGVYIQENIFGDGSISRVKISL